MIEQKISLDPDEEPEKPRSRRGGKNLPMVLTTVCAWCKRVKDEKGCWNHSGSLDRLSGTFTHGICPSCMEKVRAEEKIYLDRNR
jgi:hypothetical protein